MLLFRIAVGHGSIESWLLRLSKELSLTNFLKMIFCHTRGFSLNFFHAGRPSGMILSHKFSFFTDSHFPTEAKKASREFSEICLSQAGCGLITRALFCVFQDVLFHKERVAVMVYKVVKETIKAKLALLPGKLCYKTKTGVLVCALGTVSFARVRNSAVRGPFLTCLLHLLLTNLLSSIKADSSDNFPPGHGGHLNMQFYYCTRSLMQSHVDPDVFPQSWTCHSCNQSNQKDANIFPVAFQCLQFLQENWKMGFKKYMCITCTFFMGSATLSHALVILFKKK